MAVCCHRNCWQRSNPRWRCTSMTGCSASVPRWTVLQRWSSYPALPCPLCQTRCRPPYSWHDNSLLPMNLVDFSDFMVFLQNIPRQWRSQVQAIPSASGWTPFGAALSRNSQLPSDGDHRYLPGYRRRATCQPIRGSSSTARPAMMPMKKCSTAKSSVKPPRWRS